MSFAVRDAEKRRSYHMINRCIVSQIKYHANVELASSKV